MTSDTSFATNPADFLYSEDELNKIGVLDEGASKLVKSALEFMRKRPDLIVPNKWALECAAALGIVKAPASPISLTLSESSMTTTSSVLTVGSGATVMSEYAPSNYERVRYYNGIAGEDECPELVYRSNYTTPFRQPTGRYAQPVVKSIYGADDTPLGKIWATVLDDIRLIVKAAVNDYSCLNACRFYTHGPDSFVHNPDGVTDGGSLGPAVVWVGIPPGSTTVDIAHDASQKILELLHQNGVNDAVIEWRDAVVSRLSIPLPFALPTAPTASSKCATS
ncbi:hypothetical protein DFH05DRAFT_1491159 [Lentinula detonsa]|uniref:Uncharacterized protein n=1 Tax=Lentinula detonsa TaxID=2804962 RepID=A0A9W8P180_9AGAR|nr:hypothetical protein DFH05DRAFT_1491159 [Lentinula detonsa]